MVVDWVEANSPTPLRDYILGIVNAQPDITLTQISSSIFAQKGIKTSIFCVWAFLKSEKMSYKKTLYATERHRAYVVEAGFIWQKHR